MDIQESNFEFFLISFWKTTALDFTFNYTSIPLFYNFVPLLL